LLSRSNDTHGTARFDIYINGILHHDSSKDGIPGPSAIDQMVSVIGDGLRVN